MTEHADRSGVSRRDLIRGGVAAGATAALGLPAATASAHGGGHGNGGGRKPSQRIRLVNGRIYTMDARNRVVSSVVIEDGRFVAVGHDGHGGGGDTKTINLRGKTVVPGIVDNHNHIVLMGNRPGYHTPLENAYSIEDVQETYAARAEDIPDGAWITTIGGFHRNHLVPPSETPRLPTLSELDEAVPGNPVYISEAFAGPSVTNTLGKAFFESRGIPVGADGSIAAGFGASPTGQATFALRQTLLDFDQRKRGTIDAIAYGLSLGVTTHIDEGAFQTAGDATDGAAHEDNYSMHLPFLAVHDDGNLDARVRINFLHMESDPATPGLVERLKNAFPFFGDEMLRTGGIGEFIAQGTGEAFAQAALRVAEARWRAEVHSLGATDFLAEIAAFEAANAAFGITDLRWVIAHVPFITTEALDRLHAIGGGVSLTGWRYLAGSPTSNGPPFRMIVDHAIPSGMSSDGMQIAPMNPWIHAYYATTGINARGVLINDSQKIKRAELLRLYTSDNQWFLGEEDTIPLGTIEVGKLADLAVLNRDYFTVADEDLKQIRSVLTIVDGRIVHDDGSVRTRHD